MVLVLQLHLTSTSSSSRKHLVKGKITMILLVSFYTYSRIKDRC